MPRHGQHYGVPVNEGLTPAGNGYSPMAGAVPAVHSFTPHASESTQCEARAKNGLRCVNITQGKSSLCFGHDRVAERAKKGK